MVVTDAPAADAPTSLLQNLEATHATSIGIFSRQFPVQPVTGKIHAYVYAHKTRYADLVNEIDAYEFEWETFPPDLGAVVDVARLDPWGNPYEYQRIAGEPLTGPEKVKPRKDKSLHPLNSDYDLYSKGPDGKSKLPLTAKHSHDDIIRAGDGDFVGRAEEY